MGPQCALAELAREKASTLLEGLAHSFQAVQTHCSRRRRLSSLLSRSAQGPGRSGTERARQTERVGPGLCPRSGTDGPHVAVRGSPGPGPACLGGASPSRSADTCRPGVAGVPSGAARRLAGGREERHWAECRAEAQQCSGVTAEGPARETWGPNYPGHLPHGRSWSPIHGRMAYSGNLSVKHAVTTKMSEPPFVGSGTWPPPSEGVTREASHKGGRGPPSILGVLRTPDTSSQRPSGIPPPLH